MKYRVLLTMLRALVYAKRIFWFLGRGLGRLTGKALGPVWRWLISIHYRLSLSWRKQGGWSQLLGRLFRRNFLQIIGLAILFFLALPETKIISQPARYLPGHNSVAFNIFGSDEEFGLEEVVAGNGVNVVAPPTWSLGSINSADYELPVESDNLERDLAGIVAGGGAISAPIIMPGAVAVGKRTQIIEYAIQAGDSLSSIANKFGVSVATIMWENNLGLRSVLGLGDKLRILPVTGLVHTVRSGDNVKKIATLYDAQQSEIISFNKLNEDGANIKIGEKLIVPNGVRKQSSVAATTVRSAASYNQRVAPAASRQASSAKGFIWPSAARTITQYYGWAHHALDIAGPFQSPTYAVKAGTVVVSQCGWNGGYGCYVVIDHGGGVRSLYAHHSKLLVDVGDYINAGQTIALMGNTGNVRGRTGIHLHFEIQINGVRVNPIGYVR